MIQPAVMPAIILSTIWTFNNFNFVYLMNQGWEGTDILITRIYDFIDPSKTTIDYGLGAAFSTVIFVILIVYIFSLRKLTNFTEKSF
jgi:arabinogalactan oligomer/maltooligosaccharide transport system permease protein